MDKIRKCEDQSKELCAKLTACSPKILHHCDRETVCDLHYVYGLEQAAQPLAADLQSFGFLGYGGLWCCSVWSRTHLLNVGHVRFETW